MRIFVCCKCFWLELYVINMSDAQNIQFHGIVPSEMRGTFTFSCKCRLPAISDCMIRRFCLDWAVLVSDSVCCVGRVACIINGALHV